MSLATRRTPVWRRTSCPHCGYESSALEGDWIRARREARGLSQRALAAKVGVTGGYICHLEKHLRNGTQEIIERIVRVLK